MGEKCRGETLQYLKTANVQKSCNKNVFIDKNPLKYQGKRDNDPKILELTPKPDGLQQSTMN